MDKRSAVARGRCFPRSSKEPFLGPPGLTHGQLQLAETLRELHGCTDNGLSEQPEHFLRQMQGSVVDFLWRCRHYTIWEFEENLANLAHLLHLFPHFAATLRPGREFTRKLVRALGWLSRPTEPESPHHHNQARIVFYILAALTAPGREGRGSCCRWLTSSRAVTRGVLGAMVPHNK